MFENKMISLPYLGGEKVHMSRIIASWVNMTGNTYDIDWDEESLFWRWCVVLGIEEQDIRQMVELVNNGKLELETAAKKFYLANKGETSE